MDRRVIRPSRAFHMAVADVRKQVENEKEETEHKLRTSAKSKVLNERESWTNGRQQLLDRNEALQNKLSFSKRDNERLRSVLQKSQEEIDFLRHQVSDLEKSSDEERIAWRTKCNKDHDKAEEEMKKRGEQISALHRSLLAQKEQNGRMRACIDDLKVRSEPKDTDEWQKKISHFEKLITEKDAEIARITKKRQARTKMYLDTLEKLTDTQTALKQAEMTCQALDKKLENELAACENRFREELLKSGTSFRKELSEIQIELGKEEERRDQTPQR